MYRGFLIACLFSCFAVPDRAVADCHGGQGGGRFRERFHLFHRGGGCQSQQAGCQGGQGGGRFLFRQKTVQKGYSSAPIHAPAPAPMPMPKKAANCPECPETTNLTVLTSDIQRFESHGSKVRDALDEVNAARAARGLRPFINDPDLALAALACADYRAERLMARHSDIGDLSFIPGGKKAVAGCAAWPPSLGWGSCCTYENWTYAGAAQCLGRDGRRYMQLFVR